MAIITLDASRPGAVLHSHHYMHDHRLVSAGRDIDMMQHKASHCRLYLLVPQIPVLAAWGRLQHAEA